MTSPLEGITVLIGRPEGLAESWCRAFRDLGARVIHQPALKIEAATPRDDVLAALAELRPTDCSVFSSRPSVTHALRLPGVAQRLKSTTSWAVGRQTARALVAAGATRVRTPLEGAGADALLSDPDFPDAERAFLFAARGGRTVLAQSLEQQGVEAIMVYVYRRSPAALEPAAAEALAQPGQRIVAVGSSVAIVERLLELVGDSLRNQYLVSLGPRVTEAAARFPFAGVVTAQSPDLPSIIEAVTLISGRNIR